MYVYALKHAANWQLFTADSLYISYIVFINNGQAVNIVTFTMLRLKNFFTGQFYKRNHGKGLLITLARDLVDHTPTGKGDFFSFINFCKHGQQITIYYLFLTLHFLEDNNPIY